MTKVTDPSKKNDSCFVIMPFGGYFDKYYSDIYKPAIEAVGLFAKRADDLSRPGTIVQDIWTYTKDSRIVLADLTDRNPNVFYELGLAHALAKPAILITNSMTDVPFDLRALRVIEYDKNFSNWGQLLKEKVENSIKETLQSPISSVLPAFLDTKDIEKNKITISERDFIELRKDYELLKSEIRQEREPVKRRISLLQADEIIAEFMKNGVPEEVIMRKMKQEGVPERLIIDRIEENRELLRNE